MARRTARAGGRAKPERQPKARSQKAAPAATVEVVEEGGGMGIDAGIAIATTVLLILAFLFMDALKGKFDAGLFL
jgi:hypothetical protein